ncbi:Proteasome subunit beta type-3-A [Platanthera guangdongensis]|uniref:Proteasome subunit beta type-3-A n=1 Tax=Platanthera guangdongensis TaxID=2320717 RepID=A0ABR2MVR9_9ASPA
MVSIHSVFRSLNTMEALSWQWWGRTALLLPVIDVLAFSFRPLPPISVGSIGYTIRSILAFPASQLMPKPCKPNSSPLVRYQRLVFRHKLYQLREERDMKPETFGSLVSAILYEKRFGPYFCQPVIAGLGDDDQPFICTMDCLGAKELAKDFVVSGSASESLYGVCESMYKPDMEPEELFETISQALLASVDRDCLSGWGGHVFLV